MFANSHAFSGISVDDIDAARTFYAGTLDLDVTESDGMLTVLFEGGGELLIYAREDHEPATFTVLYFPVADIDAAVDGLMAADVELERYAGMPHDKRGIMRPPEPEYGPPIAWFKDPAGNILAVLEKSEDDTA